MGNQTETGVGYVEVRVVFDWARRDEAGTEGRTEIGFAGRVIDGGFVGKNLVSGFESGI